MMRLDQIVPFGRSLEEYALMFNLGPEDLQRRIVDCGGGPSSFTAELRSRGGTGYSVDPLYRYSSADIKKRFFAVVDQVIRQVDDTPNDWVWSYHRDSQDLRRNRTEALSRFAADYEDDRASGRYVAGALPCLPFRDDDFDLALCSHLLFLYSDLLSLEFHVASVREMLRIAREVRIFPLLTLGLAESPHLERLLHDVPSWGARASIERVHYELQRGANQMLRIVNTA